MTYSNDFRQRVLEKIKAGNSIRTVAKNFGINKDTIRLWKKAPTTPKPRKVHKNLRVDLEILRKDVEAHPDDYQYERAQRFNCAQSLISVKLKKLGITQKKTLSHPKADKKKDNIF